MKKLGLILITFLLMISLINVNIFATDTSSEDIESILNEHAEENNENGDENINIYLASAKVTSAGEVTEKEISGITYVVQQVTLKLLEGDYKGEEITIEYVLSYDIEGEIVGYELNAGNTVTAQVYEVDDYIANVTVYEYHRSTYIFVMFGILLISIVLIGGKKGLKSILILIITLLSVYFILIKNVYAGRNLYLMLLLTSAVITIFSSIINLGLNKRVITTSLSTLGGIIISIIIALISVNIAKIIGDCEDASQLGINMSSISFNLTHLFLVGAVLSSLGICLHISTYIVSHLEELHSQNQDLTSKDLFKNGMNFGKDILNTLTNTILLTYIGMALTLTILCVICNMDIIEIINKESISELAIYAITSSMGFIYTIPITSILFSILNKDKTVYKTVSENKIDGKRSLKI